MNRPITLDAGWQVLRLIAVVCLVLTGVLILFWMAVDYSACKQHRGQPVRGVFGVVCIMPAKAVTP